MIGVSRRWCLTLSPVSALVLLFVACGPQDSRSLGPAPGGFEDDESQGGETQGGEDPVGMGGMGGTGSGMETPRGVDCGEVVCEVGSCSQEAGGAVCSCPEGFGPAVDGCPDIDECADPSTCDGAFCVNTIGAFYCECPRGEEWSGEECIAVDRCELQPCDADATCVSGESGQYSCECGVGSAGNGEFCKDSPDCDAACDHGVCVETQSGFACQCSFGRSGSTDCASTCDVLNVDPVLEELIRETVGLPIESGALQPIHIENLDALDASTLDVKTLDGLECWPHLKHLNLAGTSLGDDLLNYPDPLAAIASLNQLETLNLSCTSVVELHALEEHPTLEELRVDNQAPGCDGALADPSALGGLTRLEVLALGGNPLDSFPALSSRRLYYLDLTDANLPGVPNLSDLLQLESLYLSYNSLDDISGISDLGELTDLQLGGNELTSLEDLTNLPRLRTLRAQNNELTAVGDLSGVPALVELDLSANQVSDVSGAVMHAPLSILFLAGNQISSLEPFVDSGFSGVLSVNANPLDCEEQDEVMTSLVAQGIQLFTDCE